MPAIFHRILNTKYTYIPTWHWWAHKYSWISLYSI